MPIELKDILKDVELTEEQLSEFQKKINDSITSEITTNEVGLKKKNQELINKLKVAKEKAAPENLDLDGYNEYVSNKDKIEAEKKKAEEDALIATENWNKLKNDMTNNHEQTVKTISQQKDQEIQDLKAALDKEIIENVTLKEINKAKGSQTLLMPHVKDAVRTQKMEDGSYTAIVVDKMGNERMNIETGNPLKVSDLIAEFQSNESFAGAFPIRDHGSNSNVNINAGTHNAKNNPYDKKSPHYSVTEQAKLMKTNPKLANALKASAN